MNKHIFFLINLVLLTAGCRTDFSVNGEYEERTIVHFIIDPSDKYHYLKLNKTFLGDGDATVFAQVPDSSYFNNVDARVQEIKGNEVQREWILRDTLISNKETGMFYGPDQLLYYFKDSTLINSEDSGVSYRLLIDIENGKHIVFGETELVSGVTINSPTQNIAINFMKTTTEYGAQAVRFTTGTGSVFNARLIFRYKETRASGSEIKELEWNLGTLQRSAISTPLGSFSGGGERFYQLVRESIPVDNSVIRREVSSFEIVLTAGAEDLNTYMLVSQPTSSLTQNKPEFTNLEGALGIFSSRVTVRQFKTEFIPPAIRALSGNSTRELSNGSYTVQLNFCSNLGLDNNTNFTCD